MPRKKRYAMFFARISEPGREARLPSIRIAGDIHQGEEASVVEGEEAHESAVSLEPSRPSFEVVRAFC